jgi:hypothetical protein
LFFCLAQFEKKFSLRLRRADFHKAPGLDQIVLNVCPDPPDGIRDQTIAPVGIEFRDRVDQADISFLDQVGQFVAVVAVFMGDLDDKSQIGNDQLFRRFRVVEFFQFNGQLEFLIGSQQGKIVYPGDV